jgi:glucose/arabinose dehydrogenase
MNQVMRFSASLLFFVLLSNINPCFAQSPTLSLTPVITTGLSLPIQLVNAGDGSNRVFIVQKAGDIKVFDKSFAPLGTFLSVSNVRSTENERGLLSMVFHPDYKNNGFFYVYYTNLSGNLELDRYKVSNNPNVADATSKDTLIIIPHPTNNNHNGGELHFGVDGYLYLSTGDGGGGNDVPNNAQTTTVLLGKMLRFDVNTSDTKPYYTIPPDNPFGNEVFAYGLRNPFRWSFDRLTNDMWIGDVGQDAFEEVNFRPFDSTNGVNYGWRCYEGPVAKNLSGCGPISNYNFPIYTFPTTAANSVSITGGTVYRGSTFIDLQGYYIATEYYTGNYFKIKRLGSNTWDTSSQKLSIARIADIGETENGELYAVALEAGRVLRILASGARQYKFTGNGNWDVAANWSDNTIPPSSLPAGSEILIDPPSGSECVLNIAQTIAAGAKLTVNNDKQFRVIGDLNLQ